jgi:Carboxypeptidase regulatory-like domain
MKLMKRNLILFLSLLVSNLLFAQLATLSGVVMDQDLGDVVIGANVKILQDGKVVKATVTNLDGRFKVSLPSGIYDLECEFTGMTPHKLKGVILKEGENTTVQIQLVSSSVMLNNTVIDGYKVPLTREDETSGGQTLTSEPVRVLASVAAKPGAAKKHEAAMKPAKIFPSSSGPEPESVGIRLEASEYIETSADKVSGGTSIYPAARAGLLTAGEWNDLHNWENHFTQIYADGETTQATTLSGMYPENRYAVMLKTEAGIPLANVQVELRDKNGIILWTTFTDNFGKAELWYDVFRKDAKSDKNTPKLTLFAKINGKSEEIGQAEPTKKWPEVKTIKATCKTSNAIDLMWIVDATGSMGDEINYLKAELTDVIAGVQRNLPQADIRNSAVFYRDFGGEDYVVKAAPFTSDLGAIRDYINGQRAAGGGDTPEAADSALVAGILHQKWRTEAAARICFIVLDASPHHTEQAKKNLEAAVRAAATKGIRIVPIAASGMQKETEFLMKYLAVLTNGTYVFLTDHSGIGEKHLEPTAETYSVELLNDLLVRIITEYSTQTDCEGQNNTLTIQPRDEQQPVLNWSVFPNPAMDLTNLELPEGVEFVKLFNSEGKLVRTILSPKAGVLQLPLREYAVGYYIIQIGTKQGVGTARLVVIRS